MLITAFFSCKKTQQTEYIVIEPIVLIDTNKTCYLDSLSFGPIDFLQQQNNVNLDINTKKDDLIRNRKWEGVPSIVCNKKGDIIYAAWYTGGNGDVKPGNYITLSVSINGGATWENNKLTIYPSTANGWCIDPSLWRDANDSIWLFFSSFPNQGKGVGLWRTNLSYSSITSSITYSTPEKIADGNMMNKPLTVFNGKYTLYPVSIWKSNPNMFYPGGGCFLHILQRDSANRLYKFANFNIPNNIRDQVDEPQVVETYFGMYLCFVRTKYGIYYYSSVDYGKTWSPIQQFTQLGPNPNSRFHVSKLQSGDLIMIFNNDYTRDNMKICLSRDNGKTWKYSLMLDEGVTSYPDASQSDDGYINVVFDKGRYSTNQIVYCKFREEDIVTGNKKNIFKVTINK